MGASLAGEYHRNAGRKDFLGVSDPDQDRRAHSLSADEQCAAFQRLCGLVGKVVPDWWISGWLNARYLARHLGAKIGAAKGWDWMATELAVGREGAMKIADNVELQLRGQIDLVLAQNDAPSFAGQKIWIVDYKTGSAKELKTSDLHDNLVKGTSLQLGFMH